MNYAHVMARLFNTPLMIAPGKLDAIIAGLAPRFGLQQDGDAPLGAQWLDPSMLRTQQGERKTPGYYVTDNGVAVISAFGALVHRSQMAADSTYLLGYQTVAKMLDTALADRDVEGILLEVDSPGGEVAGAFELANKIKAARGVKPVWAVADTMALSAGYLLASAAERVYMAPNGYAGSIGVIARHMDISAAMDRQGVKITPIYAGAHKDDGTPYAPLPAAVAAQYQEQINHTYAAFVDFVAGARPGLDADAVRATEAAIYQDSKAVEVGLVDGLATVDELIRALGGANAGTVTGVAAHATEEVKSMTEQNKAPEKAQTVDTVGALRAAYPDLMGQASAEAVKGAVAAERARIGGILTTEAAKGREGLAHHLAFNSDMSAEDAVKMLEAAPAMAAVVEPVQSDALAKAMEGVPNPEVGPDNIGGESAEAQAARDVEQARVAGLIR